MSDDIDNNNGAVFTYKRPCVCVFKETHSSKHCVDIKVGKVARQNKTLLTIEK